MIVENEAEFIKVWLCTKHRLIIKKIEGVGGIVSCDSNERHTPDVANPAEDLIAHSLKKGEEQSNIPPKK